VTSPSTIKWGYIWCHAVCQGLPMYMIHIYLRKYVCKHKHICTDIDTCIDIGTFIKKYVHIYIYQYIQHTYMCTTYVYISTHIYICVYMYTYICIIYINIHSYTKCASRCYHTESRPYPQSLTFSLSVYVWIYTTCFWQVSSLRQGNTLCNTLWNTYYNTHFNTLQHVLQHVLQHTLQHTLSFLEGSSSSQGSSVSDTRIVSPSPVAVCCSVLQRVAVSYSDLQSKDLQSATRASSPVAVCCSEMRWVAVCCSVWQCGSLLQCVAV